MVNFDIIVIINEQGVDAMPLVVDLMLVFILVTMMMIGYITGATTEFIKLLKLTLPFIFISYFSAPLARFIFNLPVYKSIINRIDFLNDVMYFNTIVMFVATIVGFILAFHIISAMINFLQKRIQTEKFTFKLGKFNHIIGGLLAILRFYVLISLIILPFYILNITNKEKHFMTRFIIENPPSFTRVGHIVNAGEPVVKTINTMTSFLEVVDLRQLKTYYEMVTDIEGTIRSYEQQLVQLLGNIDDPNVLLMEFVEDAERFIEREMDMSVKEQLIAANDAIAPYKGMIIWANELDFNTLSQEELLQSFNENFDTILMMTESLEMKNTLIKAHTSQQVYSNVNTWLISIGINTNNLTDLLNDANIEIILNELDEEFRKQHREGIIYNLKQIGSMDLNETLAQAEVFVLNYHREYKKLMDDIQTDIPFKYKLLAATMHKFNILSLLEQSPVMALFVADTVEFLHREGIFIMNDETIYETIVKIFVPVYLLGVEQPQIDDQRIEEAFVYFDQALKDILLTEVSVLNLIHAFLQL